jgi:hypothetical protein
VAVEVKKPAQRGVAAPQGVCALIGQTQAAAGAAVMATNDAGVENEEWHYKLSCC